MRKLRVLDLFSGIGGFSLGLERTGGFETVAFCEIEPYPRAVLAKHWPNVPIYDDVRTLTADALRRDGIAVDVICGGFPCQDLSFAGKRAGLEGARSGLWGQYARLIGELRPRFVIVENVPGLLSLGMGTVLGDLAALRYDATWDCIPAAAVGAPHRRDRVWLVAYANSQSIRGDRRSSAFGATGEVQGGSKERQRFWFDASAACGRKHDSYSAPLHRPSLVGSEPHGDHAGAGDVANTEREGLEGQHGGKLACRRGKGITSHSRESGSSLGANWSAEPDVGRVAHGIPSRVDRLRGLGNAVVPQIPELIGRAILQAEGLTP